MSGADRLRRRLIERIAEACYLDEDEIDRSRPLQEFGLSSRDAVELSGELEELLGRPLPTTLLWDHPTIDRLVDALSDPAAPAGAGTAGPPGPEAAGPAGPEAVGRAVGQAGTEAVGHAGAVGPAGAEGVGAAAAKADAPAGVRAQVQVHAQDEKTAAPDRSGGPDTDVPPEPIAVVGLGCRLPGGVHGPEQFWRLLTEGRDAVAQVPDGRWAEYGAVPDRVTRRGGFLDDIAGFDAEFFGITPDESARMDPQQRMLLEVTWEALEHAGVAPRSLSGTEGGVFVGISGTEYGARSIGDVRAADPRAATGAALSIAANRLSYALDLRGPSLAVDTACSSSLVAVHLAVQSLRSGECGLALVGGANLLLGPGVTACFDEMGVSSADGRCKPFAADADGIVRAEGVGVVVLKRLSDAQAAGDRVLARIRGTAVNSDGRSNGLTAPNGEAQQALLRAAHRQAGVDPSTVDHVEAHGTGTLLGDPIEARALGTVLGARRRRPLLIGSVKGNLGHLEAAAGIVGLIKTVLALHHGLIPPSIHCSAPNPHIPFGDLGLSVADTVRPWPTAGRPALAGVSGFGFGGTNAHAVLEQESRAKAPEGVRPPHSPRRFLLGAASEGRLREKATALADWVEHTQVDLADLEHTLARRADGRCKEAVVARTREELAARLRRQDPANVPVPAPANVPFPGYKHVSVPTPGNVSVPDCEHISVPSSGNESVPAPAHAPASPAPGNLDVPAPGNLHDPASGNLHVPAPANLHAPAPGKPHVPAPGPVFVFSGHGSQWAGMARRLLADEPVFAAAVDRLDPVIRAEAGFSLREDLLAAADATTMDHVQPMVFGIQVALAELWQHYGVRPAAVIGHSFGEVAAAVVARALTEADGARVVALRSRLLASLAGDGAMALLEADAREAAALVAGEPGVSIAVLSSPGQTVIAGSAAPVRRIVSAAEAGGRLAHLVRLDVAAHSPAVDTVTPALVDGLAGLTPQNAETPVYSTVADGRPAFDPGYWAQNLRSPVQFASAVAAAVQDGFGTFVELSPHPVLRHALSDNLAGRSGTLVLSSLRNCPDETAHFHSQLATLELAGQARPPRDGRIADVPTAPWRHTRHWFPAPAAHPPAYDRALPGDHPLLGAHTELPDDGGHVWRADLGTAAHPWLADHRLDDRPALPGAVFLETAAAAASAAFGVPVERIALRAVTLHRPLALDDHTTVTTTCTDGTIRMHTRAKDGTWRLHASAEAAVAGPECPEPLPPLDESEFVPVPVTDVHRRLRLLGLSHGPAFRGLRRPRVRSHDLRAVAELAPPQDGPRHPAALVESCLQLLAAALYDPDATVLRMPVEFGTVRLHGDLTRGARVHARIAQDDRSGGRIAELLLADEQGRILLDLTGVVVRAVPYAEFAAPLTAGLLQAVWRPAPLPVHGTEPGPILVVGERPTPLAPALGARQGGCDTMPDAGAVLFVLPSQGGLADAEKAVLAVADTVRTLAESHRPPRLLLVTTGAFAVGPDEPGNPAFASLRGLVRVLACEHPELRPGIVDLDPLWSAAEAATAVRGELSAGTDDEVAWRSGVRHAARLDRLPEPGPAASPVASAAVSPSASPVASSAVSPAASPVASASVSPAASPVVRPDGGYVITGGLGGLGIFLAGRLARQGASRIILNGRSPAGPAAAEAIDGIVASGTEVEVILGDIAEPGVAERLVAAAGRVRGVIHAAAVFDDHPTIRLDPETLHRSWLPKAYGAWRLHEVTRGLELDWWVGFSSVAALHGMPGQPAYATANACLDALVAMRRAQGLPGTSIAWGAWAEIGAVAGVDIPWLHPISPAEGMDVFAAAVGHGPAQVGALRLNTPVLVRAFPQLVQLPFFEPLLGALAGSADDWAGVDRLRTLSPHRARAAASAQLRSRIASVLGLSPDRLDLGAPLTRLGVDSLLAVRIRHAVQHDFGLTLPLSLLLRGASAAGTERWLLEALRLHDDGAPAATLIRPRDSAEWLVDAVWRDVLGVDAGVTKDFYDAGGDRSQAERVTVLLGERTGRELTVSELFEHPTIERMAAYVRDEEHLGTRPRVLRGEGTRTPLFLFHPGGGDTGVYRQLTNLLDPAIPVYGFDRIDGVATVEDRVRQYLPELRAVQPAGPYRLAGWSFGGSLAFETAQQLRGAGERVDALTLIDSIIPLPDDTGLSERDAAERRFARFVGHLEATYARRIVLPYERLAGLDDEAQAQLVVDAMRASGMVDGAVSDAILKHQRTSLLDARALERYTPSPYDGPVSFLSAADPTPGGLRDPRFDRRDPARGWDTVCADLDVTTVPGHHLALLDPPYVDAVARRLGAVLAGAVPGRPR
ncbi:beta-ketoacyl synthase N-terminal-like domain-containing protein [Streptomyces sp. NPDC020800]|uniref:beta-ketoacyl synthase N-terminal-like domain-containing protein n=1 Tax=Streptomyces sp. NPDC020800 TaxID=3365092 RepID=UPI0037945B86